MTRCRTDDGVGMALVTLAMELYVRPLRRPHSRAEMHGLLRGPEPAIHEKSGVLRVPASNVAAATSLGSARLLAAILPSMKWRRRTRYGVRST